MRKCSPLFHLLNSLTCCNGSLNRTALRISRGLCEASNALPGGSAVTIINATKTIIVGSAAERTDRQSITAEQHHTKSPSGKPSDGFPLFLFTIMFIPRFLSVDHIHG